MILATRPSTTSPTLCWRRSCSWGLLALLEAEVTVLRSRSRSKHLDLDLLVDLQYLDGWLMCVERCADADQAVDPVQVERKAPKSTMSLIGAFDYVADVQLVDDLLVTSSRSSRMRGGRGRCRRETAGPSMMPQLAVLLDVLLQVLYAADVDEGGGQEAATPRSRMRPSLTTSMTVPATVLLLSKGALDRFDVALACFLLRIRCCSASSFGHHEGVDPAEARPDVSMFCGC